MRDDASDPQRGLSVLWANGRRYLRHLTGRGGGPPGEERAGTSPAHIPLVQASGPPDGDTSGRLATPK